MKNACFAYGEGYLASGESYLMVNRVGGRDAGFQSSCQHSAFMALKSHSVDLGLDRSVIGAPFRPRINVAC